MSTFKDRPRVAIITNIIPHYRQGFYDRVLANRNYSVTVYCQEAIPGTTLRPIHSQYAGHVKLIRHWSLRGETLVWQRLPWLEIARNYDVVIVDGNPRMVAQSMLAVLLRLLRRSVVVWNILYSIRNQPFSERVRLLWWRMFDAFFLYTDREAEDLKAKGFQKAVVLAANNGLDQHRIESEKQKWSRERLTDFQAENELFGRIVVLSTGRLIERNRYQDMVEALPCVARDHPTVLWCIIGSGPSEQQLRDLVAERELNNYVRIVGALHDEEKLAPWFLSSSLFVHPGGIGLSLLHAFGYGLPVVTHNNARNQGPEYALFKNGHTGSAFEEGNVTDLGRVVSALLRDTERRKRMSNAVTSITREKHNTEVMAQRFTDLIAAVTERSGSGSPR